MSIELNSAFLTSINLKSIADSIMASLEEHLRINTMASLIKFLSVLPKSFKKLRFFEPEGYSDRISHLKAILSRVSNKTMAFEGVGLIDSAPDVDFIELMPDGSILLTDFSRTKDPVILVAKKRILKQTSSYFDDKGFKTSYNVEDYAVYGTHTFPEYNDLIPHEKLSSFNDVDNLVDNYGEYIDDWGEKIDEMIINNSNDIIESRVQSTCSEMPTLDEADTNDYSTMKSIFDKIVDEDIKNRMISTLDESTRDYFVIFPIATEIGGSEDFENAVYNSTPGDKFDVGEFTLTRMKYNFKIDTLYTHEAEFSLAHENRSVKNLETVYKMYDSWISSLKVEYEIEAPYYSRMLTVIDNCRSNIDVETTINSDISSLVNSILKKKYSHVINFYYEVAKAFVASKMKSRKGTYAISKLGAYSAYIAIKTTGSFHPMTSAEAIIIYTKSYDDLGSRSKMAYDDVTTSRWFTITERLAEWWLKMPSSFISVLSYHLELSLDEGSKTNTLDELGSRIMSYMIVNRDTFAQISDYTRYYYVSAIGLRPDVKPLLKKTSFFKPKSITEQIYVLEQMKMLAIILNMRATSTITRYSKKEDLQFRIAMPSDKYANPSFTYQVNKFYMCNLYNKCRDDKKISEAICMNGIKDETDMFYKTELERTLGYRKLDNMREFLEEQTDFCRDLLSKPDRYSFSLPYLIYISRKHSFSFKITNLNDLNPNLEDLLSTNSAASVNRSNTKNKKRKIKFPYSPEYSCVNILTEMVTRFGLNHNAGLNLTLLAYEILSKSETREFIHRVISKDQKGHREISVLNYDFRIMAFIAETMGRNTNNLDGNLVESVDKWKIFENLVMKSRVASKEESVAFLNHNIDKSRWGPNNLMNAFYAVFAPKIENRPLRRLVKNSFIAGTLKKAQLPEKLTEFVSTRRYGGKSKDIEKFTINFEDNLKTGDYLYPTPQGMCQGIYHNASSVYATVVSDHINYLLMKSGTVRHAKSLCTSDDEYKSIFG